MPRHVWEARNLRGRLKRTSWMRGIIPGSVWEARNLRGRLKHVVTLARCLVSLRLGSQESAWQIETAPHRTVAIHRRRLGSQESAWQIETAMRCGISSVRLRVWEARNLRGRLKHIILLDN